MFACQEPGSAKWQVNIVVNSDRILMVISGRAAAPGVWHRSNSRGYSPARNREMAAVQG